MKKGAQEHGPELEEAGNGHRERRQEEAWERPAQSDDMGKDRALPGKEGAGAVGGGVQGGGQTGPGQTSDYSRDLATAQSCCRNTVWPFSFFLLPQVSICMKKLINGSTVSFWESDFKLAAGRRATMGLQPSPRSSGKERSPG